MAIVKKEVKGAAQNGIKGYRQSQPQIHHKATVNNTPNLIARQKKQSAGPITYRIHFTHHA